MLTYLGFGLYLYIIQRSIIYPAVPAFNTHLPEKIFQHDHQTIKTTLLNAGKQKVILYFGGNAENVEFNADSFTHLFPDYTLYLVKYRGYAGSSGKPTEKGIFADALHIYDQVREIYDEVSVIGRSLGSGVATFVASKREVKKLVLIAPFDSVQNVAQAQFPVYPMSILLKDKYDSYQKAKYVKAETLVIAAEHDEMIPMANTKRLMEGFPFEVSFIVIDGATHNDLSISSQFEAALRGFFRPI